MNRYLVLLLGLLMMTSTAHGADLVSTIKAVKPSMVGIGVFDPLGKPQARLTGTGFAVADGGLVVTNYHVVDVALKPKEYLVAFYGSGTSPEVIAARVVAKDEEHDLVLLALQGRHLPALVLAESQALLEEGTDIAFTGYPIGAILGLTPVTHRGIVSAITPIAIPVPTAGQLTVEALKRLRNPYNIYQLDATAYPGNSGSPVYLADRAEVVAIINKVYVKETRENLLRDPSAITYAIPVRYLRDLVSNYLKK